MECNPRHIFHAYGFAITVIMKAEKDLPIQISTL